MLTHNIEKSLEYFYKSSTKNQIGVTLGLQASIWSTERWHFYYNNIIFFFLIKKMKDRSKPSIASLGTLNPSPMLFQNLLPPFPGLFPFPLFFELHKRSQKKNDFFLLFLLKIDKIDEWLPEEHLGLFQERLLRL